MRQGVLTASLLALLLAGCGSDDDVIVGGTPGGPGTTPTPAAAQATPGSQALIACLEKDGLNVEGTGDELKASGNGDVVDIRLFTSAGDADAFAKQQTADSTQAGNNVAVYGPDPKPKTVNAIETCLPQS